MSRRPLRSSPSSNSLLTTSCSNISFARPLTPIAPILSSLGKKEPEEATIRPIISRSFSYDDWEEYMAACSVLESRLIEEKQLSNVILNEYLTQTIPDMRNKCANKDYQISINELEKSVKEVMNLSSSDLKEGRCTQIVDKILNLQNNWASDWPDKRFLTKFILIVSKLTRLIHFLVKYF